jgi:hypothetical protein
MARAHLARLSRSLPAKIHCVADSDCINATKDASQLPLSLIPRNSEQTISNAIGKRDDQFVNEMVEFGMVNDGRRSRRSSLVARWVSFQVYGALVQRDHQLFFDMFRNRQIPGLQ